MIYRILEVMYVYLIPFLSIWFDIVLKSRPPDLALSRSSIDARARQTGDETPASKSFPICACRPLCHVFFAG